MTSMIPPAFIFIVGALAVPLFKGKAKSAYLLLLPVIGFANLLMLPAGTSVQVEFLSYTLTLIKTDRLSLLFGYIFHITAFITVIYSMNMKNNLEYVAGLIYSGSALGVIFVGDYLSLFFFWEMMTVGSVFLIWARKTEKSISAGFRYALFHFVGGLFLLAGIVIHAQSGGSLEFGFMGLNGLASYLIFFGFGVNCAWPFLHTWLSDAYPEATITGTIYLSAFTTKTAVYVLARAFPGTEMLIWIGAAMAAFPIFFAVIENDMRRVLAYSLINQVGFMVVGIGIGTEMAINGAAAHAFTDVLFKGLLFMSMGAVMYRTGKINATDLGGLYKTMPLTAIFCIIGAASISAFPLFSAFVSKTMVMSAVAHENYSWVWLILLFASAGVFHHAGIKIPFFAFFGHDSGLRPKEAPLNMLIAMGIAAFLCIFIGTFPGYLYSILPYPVEYEPYTTAHVVAQLQLLGFSALAFALLMLSGIYPAEKRAVNLDADLIYRKGALVFNRFNEKVIACIWAWFAKIFLDRIPGRLIWFGRNPAGVVKIGLDYIHMIIVSDDQAPKIKERIEREKKIYPGDIIDHWPIGSTVTWVTVFLLIYLLFYYF